MNIDKEAIAFGKIWGFNEEEPEEVEEELEEVEEEPEDDED